MAKTKCGLETYPARYHAESSIFITAYRSMTFIYTTSFYSTTESTQQPMWNLDSSYPLSVAERLGTFVISITQFVKAEA